MGLSRQLEYEAGEAAEARFSTPMFLAMDTLGRPTDTGERPGGAALGTTRVPSRTLVELIGQANLQAIQDAFAIAFDIPTVVLDHDGYNVSEITHRVAFCEDLTRPSNAGGRCLNCDRGGMATSAATHRPTIFHCWNDLWDCTVPIVSSRGELFGYFLSGQVFFEHQADLERYRTVAAEQGIDPDTYVSAAGAVRVMPREVYTRGIECIAVLARMIADQASAVLRHRELLDTLLAANAQTQRLAAELDTVARAASQVGGASGEGLSAIARLCDSIERVIACDSVIIFRLDDDRTLRPVVVRDPYPDAVSKWSVPVGTGIVGTVAATGEAIEVDEVTSHPLFVPVPGVPVEAEALVALPLEYAGSFVGVLQVSRFRRRTFSEHEHDLLRLLALNVAVALGTTTLRGEVVRYRQAAASQRALTERVTAGASLSELCEHTLAHADSSFTTTRAGIRISLDGAEDLSATLHMTGHALKAAERRHGEAIQRVRDREHAVAVADNHEELLICGIGGEEAPSGALLLWRKEPFSDLERDVAETLALHVGILLRDRWQQRRTRALQARSERLAELSTALGQARSRREVVGTLAHAHELVDGGVTTLVALGGLAPGVLDLWQRRDGGLARRELLVAGRPELRFPAATSSEHQSNLFDAWGRAVIREAQPQAPHTPHSTVTLSGAEGPWGALMIAVPRLLDRPERAVLQVLAQLAASSLEALEQTPDARAGQARRHAELAALHDGALRILAGLEPSEVARSICTELGELVDSDCVMLQLRESSAEEPATLATTSRRQDIRRYLLERGSGWTALRAPIVEDDAVGIPFDLSDGSRGLLVAGRCRNVCEGAVLGTFAGYAAVALSKALDAARGRREASSREHAARTVAAREARLRSLVQAHAELIAASLSAEGLGRVVRILTGLIGADVTVYDAEGHELAGTAARPAEQPELVGLAEADAVIEAHGGHATAIRDEDEHLGWLLVADAQPPADPELLTFVASAAAVALLSERAAAEIEARVRGDFVEVLLAAERPTETLAGHGRALGHDPMRPARVVVAKADDRTGPELYNLVARAGQRELGVLLAQRADELILLGPTEGDWPERLRTVLAAAGPAVRIGVGGSTETHGYRESYLGASRAVAALRHLGRSGLISIDGEGLEQLLLRAAEPELLAAFVLRVLAPVDNYDRGHTADLRRTLELCVENGWNLQASARAAHLHHSTLRYRLKRISALTGFDLRIPDDRLAVQLALMADRLLRD